MVSKMVDKEVALSDDVWVAWMGIWKVFGRVAVTVEHAVDAMVGAKAYRMGMRSVG